MRTWFSTAMRLFAIAMLCWTTSPASNAQDSSLGGGGGTGVASGGAAMADFDTLINLIQQTVDPDSWLAAGGTSTILQYPSGVYVDPKGHVKRMTETEKIAVFGNAPQLTSNSTQHPWRNSSGLRTISLKRLESALQRLASSGLPPTSEVIRLAGLSKIRYVKIDAANEDVLIAGPAGDEGLGFELQDLAVVAALINHKTAPLGCSIEPSNQGLLAAQRYLSEQGVISRLARNPRMVVEKMQEHIGDHNVKVFGMAPNTGTALALIDADEHMKKVGFGTVATRMPVNSYFDYLEKEAKVPSQSMIRWWFSYADAPIRVNKDRSLFELPEQCVAIFSEQQWVSQQGRAPTGNKDKSADAFAEGFTKRLSAMRKSHPSYARLSAVFETSLALQLAVETTGLPDLKSWFPNLCYLGSDFPEENVQPNTVDGLTTWHKLKNGTVVAVVSGGVKVDAISVATERNWEESSFLVSSLVPDQQERISSAHGSWWWDEQ